MMTYLEHGFLGLIGVPRCGTTSAAYALHKHPHLQMAAGKENGFFDTDKYFDGEGNVDPEALEFYHMFCYKFFPHVKYYFDASTIYSSSEKAISRLQKYRKDAKIIILFRNPIKRAYSHWWHHAKSNADTLSFGEAIRTEQSRFSQTPVLGYGLHSYVDQGFYIQTWRRILKYFPRENVLPIKSEHMFDNPQHELNQIYNFLGVDEFKINFKKELSNNYPEEMNEEDKKYLREVFGYSIKDLERILGWNCSDWLNI